MSKPKILIQLDPDKHSSVFDSVVAVDSGIDQLFRHQLVEATEVEGLVHGAIFTRGPADLKNTAIFVGGQDVSRGEEILNRIRKTFFGPMRVSVMLDSNGSNTTAAAAVLCAEKHLELAGCSVGILGGTGPVGQRIARLVARKGGRVWIGSRQLSRSESVCKSLQEQDESWKLQPFSTSDTAWPGQLSEVDVLFAAGAAGIELISSEQLQLLENRKVLVDLNAVPPTGIPGVEVMAAGAETDGVVGYGAIGVGGLKMKIHKTCLQRLFTANDLVLDAEQIYDLGAELS